VTPRLALFVNPAAAGGRAVRALTPAIRELDARGAEYRVLQTEGLGHARDQALEAAGSGETVVAIGGDGLVGCLAGALRHTDGRLAIVPGGRGNDLARVLGIPTDPREAARVALDGEERLIDVAEANGAPFVGIASLGFDSDANRIANEAKLVKGNLVYLYAALKALVQWRDASFTVTVNGGEPERVTGYSVAVANSKAYGGGMYLVPHAELDDGQLDVLAVAGHSKLKVLWDLPKVFKGKHADSPFAHWSKGTAVRVNADRPFTVYADGDPIAELPLTVTIDRRSLRVLVPRS